MLAIVSFFNPQFHKQCPHKGDILWHISEANFYVMA